MRTLHARLVATYVALALVLLVATGLIFSTAFINYAEATQLQRAREMTGQAASLIDSSKKQPDQLLSDLQQRYRDLDITFQPNVVIVQKGYQSGADALKPGVFSLMFARPRAPQPAAWSVPYTPSGLPVGTFWIAPKTTNAILFRTFYREVGVIVAMGLGLAILLGWWFSRWLSRPVAQLARATAAVAEGDFLQTVKPTGTPELDGLVQQFNRMVQRLDESFRSLSAERDVARRFASDAAHELKTPLTALKAYYETVQDRPERIPQVLPRMGRSIERVEGIISGLLQLARLSEGSGLELTPGDAAQVVQEMEPTFRLLARDAGHTLKTEGFDQPLPVRLDARLLEIALSNLVSNACKFTPLGGEIRITAARQDAEAVIAVEDTGPGIPESERERIFERFHRGETTQSIPGSGLGLSIVQEAVSRLGGRVTVESEVGRGSRFSIWLPIE